jgi:hypothetical protein
MPSPQVAFINGIPVINNLSQAQAFNVNLNKYEMISQSLYDSAAYPITGLAAMTFFQLPQGSGVGVISGGAKTAEDTNMQAAGNMPAMQAYIVTSFELDVQSGVPAFSATSLPAFHGAAQVITSINDVWKIRATGFLQFVIGSKAYITEGPLMKFPASNDLEIDAAIADSTTAGAANQTFAAYAKAVGPAYEIAPNNLLLIPNQNFSGTLNWATLETVTTAARIFMRLMGTLIRAAQ